MMFGTCSASNNSRCLLLLTDKLQCRLSVRDTLYTYYLLLSIITCIICIQIIILRQCICWKGGEGILPQKALKTRRKGPFLRVKSVFTEGFVLGLKYGLLQTLFCLSTRIIKNIFSCLKHMFLKALFLHFLIKSGQGAITAYSVLSFRGCIRCRSKNTRSEHFLLLGP